MRKCDKPGHVRTKPYAGGSKTDCHTCRQLRSVPLTKEQYKAKYSAEKARPGYRERQAARVRRMKYGIDSIPDGEPCGICRERPATDIDHDHASGNVRGFLCRRCNVWLGVVENADFIGRARAYMNGAEYVKTKCSRS